MPVRSGPLGRAWPGLRAGPGSPTLDWVAAWGLGLALALTAIGAGVFVHRTTPTPQSVLATGKSALVAVPAHTRPSPTTMAPSTTTTVVTPPSVPDPIPPAPVAAPEEAAPAPPAAAGTTPVSAGVVHARVTAIGDSVLMEAAHELAAGVDDFFLEAAVGRQVDDTIRAVQALRSQGPIGDDVIVQVGNNGTVTGGEFDELMSLLSDARRVVVVNVKVPREWEEPNNEVLAEGVPRWPNAVLLDWYSLGSANPDALFDDGVHLRPAGAHLLAQMILAAL